MIFPTTQIRIKTFEVFGYKASSNRLFDKEFKNLQDSGFDMCLFIVSAEQDLNAKDIEVLKFLSKTYPTKFRVILTKLDNLKNKNE